MVGTECKFFVPGLGSFDDFVIYGKGAFVQDQEIIQKCEEELPDLIKKRGGRTNGGDQ